VLTNAYNFYRVPAKKIIMRSARPANPTVPRAAFVAALLIAAAGSPAWCQAPDQLRIIVTAGEAAVHHPADKPDKGGVTIEVQVLNELELPQAGAAITFEVLPGAAVSAEDPIAPADAKGKPKARRKKKPVQLKEGQKLAAVVFEGEKTKIDSISDAEGKARITGVVGNRVNGQSRVTVRAAFEGKEGSKTVNQLNERGPLCPSKCKGIVAGSMAATGIILYETLKPGPPAGTLGSVTPTTTPPK